jgi:predicted amidohydrolase
MERFRIAAVQMNALKGEFDHNLEIHRRFSREAAAAGCRMVLFPELSTTAHYGDESVLEFAEEAQRGRIFDEMHGLARELEIVISYGLCERAHGTFYNSQVLVAPSGFVGVQRKIYASHDECFFSAWDARSTSSISVSAASGRWSATTGISSRAGACWRSRGRRSCFSPTRRGAPGGRR